MKISSLELTSPYLAAPLCGISFLPFRRICRHFGAGMAATQMVAAQALIRADKKTERLMRLADDERPVTIQLLGREPESLSQAARIVQDFGADCVDLNMGCPARKIVGGGGGSALMRDLGEAQKILRAIRRVLTVPFTIKIRAGWDESSRNFIEIAKMAEGEGVDAVTLHARTKSAAYKGKADWSLIGELKAALRIPVIGNGDVKTFEDARRMMKETGCDGVMLGRAAFEAPWVFRSLIEGCEYLPGLLERRDLLIDQYRGMVDQFGEHTGVMLMRKFVCAYTKGLRGGAEFRRSLFEEGEMNAVLARIETFFGEEIKCNGDFSS